LGATTAGWGGTDGGWSSLLDPSRSGGSGGPTAFSRSPPGDRCGAFSFKRRRQKRWRDFAGDRCGWSDGALGEDSFDPFSLRIGASGDRGLGTSGGLGRGASCRIPGSSPVLQPAGMASLTTMVCCGEL
jgi:hypothetical protein